MKAIESRLVQLSHQVWTPVPGVEPLHQLCEFQVAFPTHVPPSKTRHHSQIQSMCRMDGQIVSNADLDNESGFEGANEARTNLKGSHLMTSEYLDLDELLINLPEPLKGFLLEAQESLFECAIEPWRSGGDTEEPVIWLDDELVETAIQHFLRRIGAPRLSAPEFWDHYSAARERGLGAKPALVEASQRTPHLEASRRPKN
jgi:hypothetical protein